ncbi:hypothetical protein R3P38DRAFT_2780495 [Favolaschia claudopus]|uniref:Uncharacterized protein n=1 Tax=Favolaschia claudopus TaxID=2862362 RepID=A0AAW0B8X5_9AGAR
MSKMEQILRLDSQEYDSSLSVVNPHSVLVQITIPHAEHLQQLLGQFLPQRGVSHLSLSPLVLFFSQFLPAFHRNDYSEITIGSCSSISSHTLICSLRLRAPAIGSAHQGAALLRVRRRIDVPQQMTPAQQRAYIDGMYDFPLVDQDASLHQQMLDLLDAPGATQNGSFDQQKYELFDAPLTPIAADSDSESESAGELVLPNVAATASSPNNEADDTEVDQMISSAPTAAPFSTGTSASHTQGNDDSDDEDSLFSFDAPSPAHTDVELSEPSSLPATSTSNQTQALSDSEESEADEIMSSPPIATVTELISSPSIASSDIGSLLDSDVEFDELASDTPADDSGTAGPTTDIGSMDSDVELDDGAFGYGAESSAGSDVDLDDEMWSSPTGGLGYPESTAEADFEVDEFMSAAASPGANGRFYSEHGYILPAPSFAPITPARSETSVALSLMRSSSDSPGSDTDMDLGPYLYSPATPDATPNTSLAPITPGSDTNMDLGPYLYSPATPDATPDTSMETEDPFSAPSTPNHGQSFDPFPAPFALGSPFHRNGSVDPEQSSSPAIPTSPIFRPFRFNRPARLITYTKKDRARYGGPLFVGHSPDTPVNHEDPDTPDNHEDPATYETPTVLADALSAHSDASGEPEVETGDESETAEPQPERISRRLVCKTLLIPSAILRTAEWYNHYDFYSAVQGYPRPLIDRCQVEI